MAKSPQQIAEKYARRIAASQQDYEAGVRNPSKSWSDGYKSSVPRMVQGFQEAAANNKMQRGVDAVGDSGWQQRTLEVASRYSQSAQNAGQKYAQRANDIMGAAQAGQNAASQIAPTTFENRMQRTLANATAIRDYWKNRS